ncbi:MAG: transposase family protein, partial [Bifidobacteriaceae bacterium]|nr:transposase family protein [Bifidobacteriaceae bacterium]
MSIEVACDLDGILLTTSTPVAGARHDSAALTITRWDGLLRGHDWLADTAYASHGAITPIKKPQGRELAESEKAFNKQISSMRCAVERAIAHLKNWRIISRGYRRQLKKLPF